MTSDDDPFFFFGCWNRDNCEEGCPIVPRDAVLQALKTREGAFNFGIIAGDNVYPKTVKEGCTKYKKYYKSTLERGFEHLAASTSGKQKHVILGNHNVVKGLTDKNEPGVFEKQKEVINSYANASASVFKLYEQAATHVNKGAYDFVFINTNLFTPNYMKSFREIDSNNPIKMLSTELGKCTANTIYIVGHEPLIAAKVKDEEYFTQLKLADEVYHVIEQFYNKPDNKHKKIAYLCADVHNFQALTLKQQGKELVLPVIVCGTGGADPDLEIFEAENIEHYTTGKVHERMINGIRYDVTISALEKPYGFCIINDGSVSYHPLSGFLSDKVSSRESQCGSLHITIQSIEPAPPAKQGCPDPVTNADVIATKIKNSSGGGRSPIIIS